MRGIVNAAWVVTAGVSACRAGRKKLGRGDRGRPVRRSQDGKAFARSPETSDPVVGGE